jgi:hypothetical protein
VNGDNVPEECASKKYFKNSCSHEPYIVRKADKRKMKTINSHSVV